MSAVMYLLAQLGILSAIQTLVTVVVILILVMVVLRRS